MQKNIYNDFEGYISSVKWAVDYTAYFQKSGADFDPFKILTGTDSRQSKLNSECLSFLHDIETLIDQFRETRKKYL